MKKLVIAVDCDDVLVPSTKKIVDMYNQKFGTQVTYERAHSSNNPEWQTDKDTAESRIHDIQLTKEYASTAPFDDAVEACKKLSRHHELRMLTARPEKILHITSQMVDEHFSWVFDQLEHIGMGAGKGEYCQSMKADVIIDDNLKHLVSAKDCGVPHLIMFGDYPWSEKDNIPDYVVQCENWAEVEKEIERIAGL